MCRNGQYLPEIQNTTHFSDLLQHAPLPKRETQAHLCFSDAGAWAEQQREQHGIRPRGAAAAAEGGSRAAEGRGGGDAVVVAAIQPDDAGRLVVDAHKVCCKSKAFLERVILLVSRLVTWMLAVLWECASLMVKFVGLASGQNHVYVYTM
jgi:hypothetical protein